MNPSNPASALAKRGLPAIVVALTAGIALMLLAFATPAVNSGAKDLPLAVSGPAQTVTGITQSLEQQAPGTFVVTTYESSEAVKAAVLDRDAIGGLSIDQAGLTVRAATAAGAPYASLLRSIGAQIEASGVKVTFDDVAPLTAEDPAGAGVNSLALPLVFGGMASAVALTLTGKRRGSRVAGSVAFSLAAGLAATAILQFGLHSVAGNYLLTSLAVAAGIAAISLTVLGLESRLGFPGLGLGAALMLFIANPLSGIAFGWQWPPQPWGLLGQYLPVGAAGTAIRSMAFFDGHGATRALLVLFVWALLGGALALLKSDHDS